MIKYQIHHKIKNQRSLEECQQHERESLNLINRISNKKNTESMKQMKRIYKKIIFSTGMKMIFHPENTNISLGKINDYYPVRDYMVVAEYHIYID